ncbi:hypothetical protein GmHk_17G049397 [Glycine max]|nr:hypothetical protein GmHk_17G049397 [Glycine max]
MASRKRKSIGARPTAQYDTRRFHSLDAWNRYTDNVLGRSILPERKVEIYQTEFDDFKTELERRNLHKRLTNLADGTIDVALVKEFYANLYSSEDPSPKQARVRGQLVKIDVDNFNIFLETPVVLEEGETLPTNSRYCRLPTDHREIEVALCIPGRGFILNVEGHPGRTLLLQLGPYISYIRSYCGQSQLIFGLVSHMDMNIGALISGQMTFIAQSNSCRLGFPTLITALCQARGVVSDSLTFERLSPTINLAYISKNCWNLDDLTVAFRGTRRARERPADIPSSSAAPTPTSAAPSVPTHVDSQHNEAMLQTPPGSILLVEQFLERVAWPRAQPSLDREDEGPTAQVPQQVQDASSETTIPEPFILHPKAEEEQARPETTTTPERSLEGTSEPPTPVADLSSPQPAVDPSTPILDILKDQTTPVLTLNTSPPATPVLHLTNEEDAQTQDTQDLGPKVVTISEDIVFDALRKTIMDVIEGYRILPHSSNGLIDLNATFDRPLDEILVLMHKPRKPRSTNEIIALMHDKYLVLKVVSHSAQMLPLPTHMQVKAYVEWFGY